MNERVSKKVVTETNELNDHNKWEWNKLEESNELNEINKLN